mmetsp:Transcript_54335/g.175676  ORF Transcript_54335/g.175676 Transcript_54335/m.175676 type:complete len:474 (-) Transcript_54335:52-1473(-)
MLAQTHDVDLQLSEAARQATSEMSPSESETSNILATCCKWPGRSGKLEQRTSLAGRIQDTMLIEPPRGASTHSKSRANVTAPSRPNLNVNSLPTKCCPICLCMLFELSPLVPWRSFALLLVLLLVPLPAPAPLLPSAPSSAEAPCRDLARLARFPKAGRHNGETVPNEATERTTSPAFAAAKRSTSGSRAAILRRSATYSSGFSSNMKIRRIISSELRTLSCAGINNRANHLLSQLKIGFASTAATSPIARPTECLVEGASTVYFALRICSQNSQVPQSLPLFVTISQPSWGRKARDKLSNKLSSIPSSTQDNFAALLFVKWRCGVRATNTRRNWVVSKSNGKAALYKNNGMGHQCGNAGGPLPRASTRNGTIKGSSTTGHMPKDSKRASVPFAVKSLKERCRRSHTSPYICGSVPTTRRNCGRPMFGNGCKNRTSSVRTTKRSYSAKRRQGHDSCALIRTRSASSARIQPSS